MRLKIVPEGVDRLADVAEEFVDRAWIDDEGDESDVAAADEAHQGKRLGDPCEELGPCDAGGVVGTRCVGGGAFCRNIRRTVTRVRRAKERRGGVPPLADIPDGKCRDSEPELVGRREHAVVAMPMCLWRWHEIGNPVEQFVWREIDDALRVDRC